MKTLHASHSEFSDTFFQLEVLNGKRNTTGFPSFEGRLRDIHQYPLKASSVEILQVNMGYQCNQTCHHCHVDAGPDRTEVITKETLQFCLDAVDQDEIQTVDITGGAPELNNHFRWFVEELSKRKTHIIVRCNLTIILANKKYHSLPEFFKNNNVEVVSSLPYYSKMRTDHQRGEGVFEKSIKALRMLNDVGYGLEESGLVLNLVYNPSGAFLPASQAGLEKDFKRQLMSKYGIVFNNLFAIANLPISRYLEYLLASGNYEQYMQKLVDAFNPAAVSNLMCKNTISVGWDGTLYDCDFNQMLDLPVAVLPNRHIKDFNKGKLNDRQIVINQHCYGCTAGAGSSCGGAII